jgi:Predicted acetyltransferase
MNRVNELINAYFNACILLCSERIEYPRFKLIASEDIDDNYWNLALTSDAIDIEEIKTIWPQVKEEMVKRDRQPAILIPNSNELNPTTLKTINLEPIYQDCWLSLENTKEFSEYKSSLNLDIIKVDETLKEEFVSAVMSGFAGDDPSDPYAELPECYAIALRKTFDKAIGEGKLIHYLVKHNGNSVGTSSIITCDKIAFIYNVTTNKEYKRKGICKELMSKMIHDLGDNVKTVCLQTEKGFYTETVYKNMGFKEEFTTYSYKEVKGNE